eukprot:CAMPEP_0172696424 /NCGR_PEP_ID=MMETSP1074-20121228/28041_1 /TAXON_ID=2916 /ORGANISM="Ceratium fusus, Strain PA161109" /LENGTH=700 /DNA_ID=CAMNT_0013517173 /DNA_START=38 /DNA_END=2138 /DNA_ORIENTATION=-
MAVQDSTFHQLLSQLASEFDRLYSENQQLSAGNALLTCQLHACTRNEEGLKGITDIALPASSNDVPKPEPVKVNDPGSVHFSPNAPSLADPPVPPVVSNTPIPPVVKGDHPEVSQASDKDDAIETSQTASRFVGTVSKVLATKVRKMPPMTVNGSLIRAGFQMQKGNRWILNPEQSSFLKGWKLFVMGILCYVAIMAPVQVAILPAPQGVDALLVTNCLIDVSFAMDMVLQFFIMYQHQTNLGFEWESRQWYIAKRYLKSWFLLDLVSLIPFDIISLLSAAGSKATAIKLVRLLRLLKLVRFCRTLRILRQLELHMSITYAKLALLKIFFLLMIIAHWLANLWALSLTMVHEGDRWIDSITEREHESGVADLTVDTPWKLYLISMYFTIYTITSVGYGDIGPKNTVETFISIIIIIASGVSWAILLGQVCGVVAGLGEEESDFRSVMDGLNSMMQDRLLPHDMRLRLRKFFLASKLAQRRAYRQQRLIRLMSPGLQGEVVMMMNQRWMAKVRIINRIMYETQNIRAADNHLGAFWMLFLVDLSMKLETQIFSQTEVVGSQQTLYIVMKGLLACCGRIFYQGCVWGDDFLLSDSSLASPIESSALTYVEIASLGRQNFLDVVEVHGRRLPELPRIVSYYIRWLALQRQSKGKCEGDAILHKKSSTSSVFEDPSAGSNFYTACRSADGDCFNGSRMSKQMAI